MNSSYKRSIALSALGVIFPALWGCLDAQRTYFARQPITLADLGAGAPEAAANSWQMRATEFSWPRLPARVALARVTRSTDASTAGNAATLLLDPPAQVEKPPWIECLRDIVEVSEVYFLQPDDFPHRPLTTTEIANRAAQQEARLCLVFGQSDLGNQSAEVCGTLIDTRDLQVIATLRAHADPALHGFEADRPKNRPESDNRHARADWQAAECFRQLLHTCVLELITREKMAAAPRAPESPGTGS